MPCGSGEVEQGGFTSGRRKDPKTLFPGMTPGNLRSATRQRPGEFLLRCNIAVKEIGAPGAVNPFLISRGTVAKSALLLGSPPPSGGALAAFCGGGRGEVGEEVGHGAHISSE